MEMPEYANVLSEFVSVQQHHDDAHGATVVGTLLLLLHTPFFCLGRFGQILEKGDFNI